MLAKILLFWVYGVTSVGADVYRDERGWLYITKNCGVFAVGATVQVQISEDQGNMIDFGRNACTLEAIIKGVGQ